MIPPEENAVTAETAESEEITTADDITSPLSPTVVVETDTSGERPLYNDRNLDNPTETGIDPSKGNTDTTTAVPQSAPIQESTRYRSTVTNVSGMVSGRSRKSAKRKLYARNVALHRYVSSMVRAIEALSSPPLPICIVPEIGIKADQSHLNHDSIPQTTRISNTETAEKSVGDLYLLEDNILVTYNLLEEPTDESSVYNPFCLDLRQADPHTHWYESSENAALSASVNSEFDVDKGTEGGDASEVTVKSTSGIRFIGISNLGATCYMNSYLQSLFMNLDFRKELQNVRDAWISQADQQSFQKDVRSPGLARTVSVDTSSETESSYSRRRTRTQTGDSSPPMTIAGSPVKSASRSRSPANNGLLKALYSLFDMLHPDSNARFADASAVAGALQIAIRNEGDPAEFATILLSELERQLPSPFNFVPRLFEGKTTHQVRCSSCQKVSSRQDKFLELRAVVPDFDKKRTASTERSTERRQSLSSDAGLSVATFPFSMQSVSLESLLRKAMYFKESLEGQNAYFCETCSRLVTAEKIAKVATLPPYLHLLIQRLGYAPHGGGRYKIRTCVDFPLKLEIGVSHIDSSHEEPMNITRIASGLLEVPSERKHVSAPEGSIFVIKSEDGTQFEEEDKLQNPFTHPPSYFEATDTVRTTIQPAAVYDLVAVLEHSGSTAHSGHYLAYCRDPYPAAPQDPVSGESLFSERLKKVRRQCFALLQSMIDIRKRSETMLDARINPQLQTLESSAEDTPEVGGQVETAPTSKPFSQIIPSLYWVQHCGLLFSGSVIGAAAMMEDALKPVQIRSLFGAAQIQDEARKPALIGHLRNRSTPQRAAAIAGIERAAQRRAVRDVPYDLFETNIGLPRGAAGQSRRKKSANVMKHEAMYEIPLNQNPYFDEALDRVQSLSGSHDGVGALSGTLDTIQALSGMQPPSGQDPIVMTEPFGGHTVASVSLNTPDALWEANHGGSATQSAIQPMSAQPAVSLSSAPEAGTLSYANAATPLYRESLTPAPTPMTSTPIISAPIMAPSIPATERMTSAQYAAALQAQQAIMGYQAQLAYLQYYNQFFLRPPAFVNMPWGAVPSSATAANVPMMQSLDPNYAGASPPNFYNTTAPSPMYIRPAEPMSAVLQRTTSLDESSPAFAQSFNASTFNILENNLPTSQFDPANQDQYPPPGGSGLSGGSNQSTADQDESSSDHVNVDPSPGLAPEGPPTKRRRHSSLEKADETSFSQQHAADSGDEKESACEIPASQQSIAVLPGAVEGRTEDDPENDLSHSGVSSVPTSPPNRRSLSGDEKQDTPAPALLRPKRAGRRPVRTQNPTGENLEVATVTSPLSSERSPASDGRRRSKRQSSRTAEQMMTQLADSGDEAGIDHDSSDAAARGSSKKRRKKRGLRTGKARAEGTGERLKTGPKARPRGRSTRTNASIASMVELMNSARSTPESGTNYAANAKLIRPLLLGPLAHEVARIMFGRWWRFDDAEVREWNIAMSLGFCGKLEEGRPILQRGRLFSRNAYFLVYKKRSAPEDWLSDEACEMNATSYEDFAAEQLAGMSSVTNQYQWQQDFFETEAATNLYATALSFAKGLAFHRRFEVPRILSLLLEGKKQLCRARYRALQSPKGRIAFEKALCAHSFVPTVWLQAFFEGIDAPTTASLLHVTPSLSLQHEGAVCTSISINPAEDISGMNSPPVFIDYSAVVCAHSFSCTYKREGDFYEEQAETKCSVHPAAIWRGDVKLIPTAVYRAICDIYNLQLTANGQFLDFQQAQLSEACCSLCSRGVTLLARLHMHQREILLHLLAVALLANLSSRATFATQETLLIISNYIKDVFPHYGLLQLQDAVSKAVTSENLAVKTDEENINNTLVSTHSASEAANIAATVGWQRIRKLYALQKISEMKSQPNTYAGRMPGDSHLIDDELLGYMATEVANPDITTLQSLLQQFLTNYVAEVLEKAPLMLAENQLSQKADEPTEPHSSPVNGNDTVAKQVMVAETTFAANTPGISGEFATSVSMAQNEIDGAAEDFMRANAYIFNGIGNYDDSQHSEGEIRSEQPELMWVSIQQLQEVYFLLGGSENSREETYSFSEAMNDVSLKILTLEEMQRQTDFGNPVFPEHHCVSRNLFPPLDKVILLDDERFLQCSHKMVKPIPPFKGPGPVLVPAVLVQSLLDCEKKRVAILQEEFRLSHAKIRFDCTMPARNLIRDWKLLADPLFIDTDFLSSGVCPTCAETSVRIYAGKLWHAKRTCTL